MPPVRRLVPLCLAAVFALLPARVARAQWAVDGRVVCGAASNQFIAANQFNPVAIVDSTGATLVTWSDNRSGTSDIYLQRVLSTGVVDPAWPANGRAVCTAVAAQTAPSLASDGAGGALVTWQDFRVGGQDVYCQHVLASGAVDPLWAVDGQLMCAASGDQYNPGVVSDGGGGAIVAWQDQRNGNLDIYAQHILPWGEIDGQWPTNGRALCTAANTQQSPAVVADGAGGVLVAWQDFRSGVSNDVYAQHVMTGGVVDPAWPADGRAICTATGDQSKPAIISDGAGGLFAAWDDNRGTSRDVYVQHVQSSGAIDPAWTPDGVAACTATGSQFSPRITTDGKGGVISTWYDYRAGSGPNIYAQRVRSTGVVDPAWTADGVALCTAANSQETPVAVSDGAGGAIVTWQDQRAGNYDIYATHVGPTGQVDPTWPQDGRALCIASGNQLNPTAVMDGGGGAIVAWQDSRSGTADIYIQRVQFCGELSAVGKCRVDGLPVCSAVGSQEAPSLVSDDENGAIIVWQDARAGSSNYDIYVHHVFDGGLDWVDQAWPQSGRLVCGATGNQNHAVVARDGAGGAIVAWEDNRGGGSDIYAAHVLANGTVDPAWTADGVAICTAGDSQTFPVIVSDGAGGAVVAWLDFRDGAMTDTYDIYAQHIQSTGQVDPAWPANGLAVCTASGDQGGLVMTSDGSGGAILAWHDLRGVGFDIYAQHVTAGGLADLVWPVDGVAVCSATGDQQVPAIVSDGAGGALIAWQDTRVSPTRIYAQRVLSNGIVDPSWPVDGRPLCAVAYVQSNPVLAQDGAGGALAAWQDYRSGTSNDIYAQHLSQAGVIDAAWPSNGRALCVATGEQQSPAIVPDGSGGAIVSWQDVRSGTLDLYGQHVSSGGVVDPSWTVGGVSLTGAANNQIAPSMVTDGMGGAIIAWQDSRYNAAVYDIYAQRVYAYGQIVTGVAPRVAPGTMVMAAPYPNPARNGGVHIRFELPAPQRVSIRVLDVAGHRVRTLASDRLFAAGPQALTWDGAGEDGRRVGGGVYFVQVKGAGPAEVRRVVLLH